MNTNTKQFEDRSTSECFQQILSQTTNRQISIDVETEKLLGRLAEFFAEELVKKSDDVAQHRTKNNGGQSIEKKDVEFVLKNQWKLYDSSAYFERKKT